jgi:glycogen(starch) synthase
MTLTHPKTGKPLRVLYVDGPGDVAGTYRQWQLGNDDSTEVSRTFSGDVYDLVRETGIEAFILATHPEKQTLQAGMMTIEHRPVSSRWRGGLKYHLGELKHAASLVADSMRFKADAIIVADQLHWFALMPLRLMGKKIIVMLHCAFWPKGYRADTGITKVLRRLNSSFWRHAVDATLCVSPEVERQLMEITGPVPGPIFQVRSQYHRGFFGRIKAPSYQAGGNFQVFFAGRLERDKGIFDLLEMATRLNAANPGAFTFELAGGGSAAEELAKQVEERGAGAYFRLLGKQDRAGMAEAFGRSHAVIVPTNAGFTEGMNRVVIEGVLAGRPVITSPVTHASDVLGHALVEVPVNDHAAYEAALERLRNDSEYYEQLRMAARRGTEAFYDRAQGYQAGLAKALRYCFPQAVTTRTAEDDEQPLQRAS